MPPLLWTPRERAIVSILLFCVLSLLTYRYFTRPTYLPNTNSREPTAPGLLSQLDPNTAPWQQLALLPNLGEKKAKSIVSYRQQFQRDHPSNIAFLTPTDLTNIKGIGDTTATNLTPYLTFPTPQN